jgi:sulfate adenylyltransferase
MCLSSEGNNSQGQPFYGPYDAQELVKQHAKEIGIELVTFQMVVYAPKENKYIPMDEVSPGMETLNISGTELR